MLEPDTFKNDFSSYDTESDVSLKPFLLSSSLNRSMSNSSRGTEHQPAPTHPPRKEPIGLEHLETARSDSYQLSIGSYFQVPSQVRGPRTKLQPDDEGQDTDTSEILFSKAEYVPQIFSSRYLTES